ncbi:MAG: hypothetical protein Fur0046_22590 [Cyanobacteria bacterium J069]
MTQRLHGRPLSVGGGWLLLTPKTHAICPPEPSYFQNACLYTPLQEMGLFKLREKVLATLIGNTANGGKAECTKAQVTNHKTAFASVSFDWRVGAKA